MLPLQYSGLENSMDCIVHGVAKSWTQLSDFPFLSPPLTSLVAPSACQCRNCGFNLRVGRSLEEDTTTHSSILAWEIPWTEKPDRP